MFTEVILIFCKIPKYVQAQNNILCRSIAIIYGWWKQAGSVPYNQKFSRKINALFFQAVPLKGLSHLPGQAAPYNQLLIQPLLLVSENVVLHKMFKLGF